MPSYLKHMPQVQDYMRRLDALQESWGNLSLLSQMTGGGTDLAATREAFEGLSKELVSHLTSETLRKVVTELGARAQVAIDILVRNLFERTADIGFLAIDDDIVRFMRDWQQGGGGDVDAHHAAPLRARFREYAAKYSVYGNVVLLAPDGRVLVQLDEANPTTRSADTLVGRTLSTTAAYVESFGATDLAPGTAPVLVYSWRVEDQRRALGVLALCFRFDDEMRTVFDSLRNGEDDWAVLALLDPRRRVIASSDPWQLPVGAPLPAAGASEGGVVRFAGREYLAVTRATGGYQSYMGPAGWTAQALLPLEHAFAQQASDEIAQIDAPLLAAAHQGANIFSAELRAIPKRADRIQRDLNRQVWNGNIRQGAGHGTGQADGDAFSGVLLREISSTGRRTQELFARSIGDLQETVLSSLLQDGRFRASLAVDILDRNLYERANDCRWWALNGTLRNCLDGKADAAAATRILEQVNALYTVYDHLVLFDRNCRVVAVSKPGRAGLVGQRLTQEWAGQALALRDAQAWAVSRFEPLESYDGRPTWVFATSVRGQDGGIRGGIAIVFDAAPQVEAMLRDVLPGASGAQAADSIALFVDGDARIIASTSPDHTVGEVLALPERLLKPAANGAVDIVQLADGYAAAGARRCGGYREFPGLAVTAIVLRRLGDLTAEVAAALPHRQFHARLEQGAPAGRVATFASAGQWLAIPAEQIVEAVEGDNITRVPGGSNWYPGVVRFDDSMIPVIDLARWNHQRVRGAANTIVVVQHERTRLGLLIDQLGDVIDVGGGDIVAVDVQGGTPASAPPRVVKLRDAGEGALPIVDVEALVVGLR